MLSPCKYYDFDVAASSLLAFKNAYFDEKVTASTDLRRGVCMNV